MWCGVVKDAGAQLMRSVDLLCADGGIESAVGSSYELALRCWLFSVGPGRSWGCVPARSSMARAVQNSSSSTRACEVRALVEWWW